MAVVMATLIDGAVMIVMTLCDDGDANHGSVS